MARPTLPAQIDTGCRSDLLSVDGTPVSTRIVGDQASAVEQRALDLEPCAPASGGVTLAAGQHLVRSADGRSTGLDVDSLTLASAAGGQPLPLGAGGSVTPPATKAAPTVKVLDNGRTKMHLRVTGADAPFWLVLGQSQNAGWRATVDGKDLGESTLVDGYANGWRVTPHSAGKSIDVTLEWVPQRVVWGALAISGITLLVCLALAFGLRRRRSRGTAKAPVAADDATLASFRASPDGARAGPGPLSRFALVAGTATVALSGFVVARWWVGLIAAAAFARGGAPAPALDPRRRCTRSRRRRGDVHHRAAAAQRLRAAARMAELLQPGEHDRLVGCGAARSRRAARDPPAPRRTQVQETGIRPTRCFRPASPTPR